MERIHFIKPTSETDKYIKPGRKTVLCFYKQRIFSESLDYIQLVAEHLKLDNIVFLCLDLVNKTEEEAARVRFGVSTLPLLVMYDGTIKPSGKPGRRMTHVSDVTSVRSALKGFELPVDQLDPMVNLEDTGFHDGCPACQERAELLYNAQLEDYFEDQ